MTDTTTPVPVASCSTATPKVPTRQTVRKFAEFLAPGYKLFDWVWVSDYPVTADAIERETWVLIGQLISEGSADIRTGGLRVFVERGFIRLGWEILPVFPKGSEEDERLYYARKTRGVTSAAEWPCASTEKN